VIERYYVIGAVYKAKWLTKNLDVACKLITTPANKTKAEHLEKSFRKELAAYAELSGPYILKTYGYAEELLPNGTKQFFLVMEYMERGSLRSLLESNEKLSIRRKLEMACHVASGMRKLHAHNMIHRDIRPDNILVDKSYRAKIGDMGIAREYDSEQLMTQIGCKNFMPPEFYNKDYDQSLDVFTFGLTLNQLFTETVHEYGMDVRTFRPKAKITRKSPVFEELIERCLRDNPTHRPSALEIETTLNLYERAFSKLITLRYITSTPEGKDKAFLQFYGEFDPQAREVLAKRFPPPPPTQNRMEPDDKDIPAIPPEIQKLLICMFGGNIN
jgi:serine/threonine protein kinase